MCSILRSLCGAASLLLAVGVALADAPPLPYSEVPELTQVWEIPLGTYGFVSVMPDGEKAVYLDKDEITVFQVKTGKKTRQVPHNFREPYGVSCSESGVCDWRSAFGGGRYQSSTAKLAGAKRSVGLKAADPRFSADGNLLVCASIDGPLLYSTDTGDWGKRLAALELDEPVAASFLDSGRKFFAVNKEGNYVIGDATSGKQLLRGQLPEWPASYDRFQNRNDDLRPLSVRPTDNELLIADGKSIFVYDLSVVPSLARKYQTSLEPRFLDVADAAPVGVATADLSHIQTRWVQGDAEAVVFDTANGKAVGKLSGCSSLPSLSVTSDGTFVVAVVGRPGGKRKPDLWFLRCWSVNAGA